MKIKDVIKPFRNEGTAFSGCTLKQAHRKNISDAARYAAYIQIARDEGDYESADMYRAIVESLGCLVRQETKSTVVMDGVWVDWEKKRLNEKNSKRIAENERKRKLKRDAKRHYKGE